MSVIVLPANDQNRPIVMAAIAAGQTVLWLLGSRLSYFWDGAAMSSAIDPNTASTVTSGYQVTASTMGMAATLPNPPGIPATDTVPANYGGLNLNTCAISADDWALLYFKSTGLQS